MKKIIRNGIIYEQLSCFSVKQFILSHLLKYKTMFEKFIVPLVIILISSKTERDLQNIKVPT